MKTKNGFAERDEIVERIKSNSGYWNGEYRLALAQREFCRWMAEGGRSRDEAGKLAGALCDECELEADAVTLEWYERLQEEHIRDCRKNQGEAAQKIDHLRLQVEATSEKAKAAKSELTEAQSYLQQLARAFSEPMVPALPALPDRQMQIAMDGEEWRLVPLAEVLNESPKLKAVALEKLGNINLGAYADLAKKWANAGKPSKITAKQFEQIEAVVQAWHQENGEAVGDEYEDDGDGMDGEE